MSAEIGHKMKLSVWVNFWRVEVNLKQIPAIDTFSTLILFHIQLTLAKPNGMEDGSSLDKTGTYPSWTCMSVANLVINAVIMEDAISD